MTGTGQRVSNIGDISEVNYTLELIVDAARDKPPSPCSCFLRFLCPAIDGLLFPAMGAWPHPGRRPSNSDSFGHWGCSLLGLGVCPYRCWLCGCKTVSLSSAVARRASRRSRSVVSSTLLSEPSNLGVARPNHVGSLFGSFWCLVMAISNNQNCLSSNSAPHRDGREASRLGQPSSAPARGRER